MKKLIIFLFVLISAYGNAQAPEILYRVSSISAMKSYSGQANRIRVTATNEDYVTCPACTADEITVYAGTGARKWQLTPEAFTLKNASAAGLDSLMHVITANKSVLLKRIGITGTGVTKVIDSNSITYTIPTASGTVASFSAGDLSPLFTTSEATATTTPALTFSATTQTANKVYAGPSSGSAAAPTFRILVNSDLPAIITSNDVTITDSTKGIILTAPNGALYRIKVHNDATLYTQLVGSIPLAPLNFTSTSGSFAESPTGTWGGVSDGYGVASSTIAPSTNGIFEAEYGGTTNRAMVIALDEDPDLENPLGVSDYGFYVNASGNYQSVSAGYGQFVAHAAAVVGDKYWLKRTGSTITSGYTRGGTPTTLLTFTVTKSTILYRKAGQYGSAYLLNPKGD